MDRAAELKPGFTVRTVLALLIASAVFLPVNTYLLLVAGTSIAGAAVYILVLLFTELSSIIGVSMTKQEITLVLALGGLAAGTASYLGMVFRHYVATSPLSWSFVDPFSKRPLPELIPSWYAPSYTSEAAALRTFMHPDWLIPLIVVNVQFGLFYVLQEIALAMICSLVFIERENLTFPYAHVNAQLITTLTEREPHQIRTFTLAAIAGIVYGTIVYAIPTLAMGAYGTLVQIIPIPWVDLTTGYYGVDQFMPGAIFGIATDPLSWALGALLPLRTSVFIAIGSLSVWVFGNWLATTYFRDAFPAWAAEWRRGMDLSLVWQRSYLRIWAVPSVGFVFALATLTLAIGWRSFVGAFKALASVKGGSESRLGFPSLRSILAMYLAGALGSVALFQALVPGFPVAFSLMTIPLSFVIAVAGARARGETGLSISIPYLWNALVLASGYPKVDAWFISPVIGGDSAPAWTESIKTALLTETKPIDFFKAYALTVVLYNIFSFIYVQFFWAIAPIPSSQYPYVMAYWPVQLISMGIWVSREIVASMTLLLYAYASMLSVGIAGILANRYFGLPFDFTALVTGTQTIPPYAMAILMGSIIGKIVESRVGRESYMRNRNTVIAGLGMGLGVVVGIASAITLVFKSTWIKPF
ncbi:MAG: hypothetical protein LM590_08700 [Thermofilum sp.]|nr:hypothetical protein [Thermofilum sp.]MCC6065103.1 hypothetical protein [Thermofilum sp.]